MAREVVDQSIEGSCEGHKDVAITGPGARVGACSIVLRKETISLADAYARRAVCRLK